MVVESAASSPSSADSQIVYHRISTGPKWRSVSTFSAKSVSARTFWTIESVPVTVPTPLGNYSWSTWTIAAQCVRTILMIPWRLCAATCFAVNAFKQTKHVSCVQSSSRWTSVCNDRSIKYWVLAIFLFYCCLSPLQWLNSLIEKVFF